MGESRIKTVTFDVGMTILAAHPSVGSVYSEVSRANGVDVDPKIVEQRFFEAWTVCKKRRLEQGLLVYGTTHEEAKQFWHGILNEVFSDDGISPDLRRNLIEALYGVFAKPSRWRLINGFKGALEACRRYGLGVGLISNWDLRLRGLLEEMGVLATVDFAVISAEAAVEKPAPEIFEKAVALAGCPPENILHIGDSWAEDVLGASVAGFQAAWFNPTAAEPPGELPENSLELRGYAEFEDVLKKTCDSI